MFQIYTHIFWDFDGTLFDTYPMIARALQETFREELNVEEPVTEIYARMKTTIRQALAYYREKYELSDDFIRRYEERRRAFELQAKPYAGVHELLEELSRRGAKHYLYTHRDLSAAEMLAGYELDSYFEQLITAEDGFPFKPEPDALVTVMKQLSIPKESALMVGDREIDVLAGRNAGMASCLIGSPAESLATYVVPDIAALASLLLSSNVINRKQVEQQ